MKQNLRRLLTGTLIGAMGIFALIPSAHARLIFTTEIDGTSDDSSYIDTDDSSTTFINLGFGSDLDHSLKYDIPNDKFILTDALDLSGLELMNFSFDQETTGPVTCADGTKGQVYYNTSTNDLKLCNGTAWVALAAGGIGDDSITGAMLATAVAGVGLVQDGSGNLDVSLTELTAATVDVAADSIAIIDANASNNTRKESILDFVAGIVGNGLTSTSGVAAVRSETTASDTIAPVSVTATGVGVKVDNATIDHSTGTIGIKDAGVTATQLASSVTGNGLSGGAGTALTVSADSTTGATVAPVSVVANGVGVKVDNATIDHSTGTIGIKDGGVTATQLADSVAGAGLAGGTGTALSVGAGNGVTVNANDITINADSTTGATVAPVSVVANGVGVTVDNATIDHDTGTIGIKDAGVTATQLASSVTGNGLSGGAGTSLSVSADSTTGATVAPVSVVANGVGVTVDNATIDHSTGTIGIKDAGVTFTQLAAREVTYTLTPEFENFTLSADGGENVGTMYADYDITNKRNYYQWTTKNTSTAQDYDLVLQWAVPENMQGFSLTNPEIEIDYKTDTVTAADNQLDITLLDTAGTVVALTGGTALKSTVAGDWVDGADITFTGGTFTSGEYITMIIKMSSKATSTSDLNPAFIGQIKFNALVK